MVLTLIATAIGTPNDLAGVAAFLASSTSDYVTGVGATARRRRSISLHSTWVRILKELAELVPERFAISRSLRL